jgi:CubicO group peptidase (beta-lactamase class C family)
VLPGAVVAIARNGRIAYLEAVGTQDRNKTIPLKADAIFWIASMTKPVTSVAAMMLSDQGKLDLTAPVYRYLPELEAMQVAVERPDPATGTSSLVLEPRKRPMTVLDLLRHTSGLIYPEEGNTAVYKLYRRALSFRRDETLAEFVSSLAKLPLAHQPGEVWEYSLGVDVLAHVIEVVSGQPFDRFLEARGGVRAGGSALRSAPIPTRASSLARLEASRGEDSGARSSGLIWRRNLSSCN